MQKRKHYSKVDFKTIFLQIKHFFRNLKLQTLILTGLVIVGLFFTFSAVNRLATNWQLEESYQKSLRQLELLQLEVETLELDNAYYNTTEYQELAARRFANKKFPGENMVYLPENSEVAKSKHTANQQIIEKTYTNLEKWRRFFFPATN